MYKLLPIVTYQTAVHLEHSGKLNGSKMALFCFHEQENESSEKKEPQAKYIINANGSIV